MQLEVQTSPTHSVKWSVSVNGRLTASWSRDGKKLFFIPHEELMVAEIEKDSKLRGTPNLFSETCLPTNGRCDSRIDNRALKLERELFLYRL